MANEFKIKKGLIVQGSGSTTLDIQGSQGQLFSVTDSLTGSLFSVNDISGIPILEAFSDDRVLIGTFNAEAIKVSGSTATITGSLLGTSSFAQTASFAPSYLPITLPQTTGLEISFTQDRVYGTFALPETGSAITLNTASAILGVTNLIIHSASAAPTTGSDFKKLSGSPNYVPGLNYIYCTYIADNQIIYSINQAT
jgi:hypothetical protein